MNTYQAKVMKNGQRSEYAVRECAANLAFELMLRSESLYNTPLNITITIINNGESDVIAKIEVH